MLGSAFLGLFSLNVLKTFKFLWEFLEGITEWKNTILVSSQVNLMGRTVSVWSYVGSLITSPMAGSWAPAFLWAPGPSYLEYTSPGMSVPSVSFGTHSVSLLEWDFCWLPLMKYSSQACLVPFCFLPWHRRMPAWHHCGVLQHCVTVHTALVPGLERACCTVETLEILVEWIERTRLLREVCTWERVTPVTVKWLGSYCHTHPGIQWKPKPRSMW